MVTEFDIARSIAAGSLPSPTEFMGSTFFAVRVSGTGVAWRPSIGEFGYRDPRIWLGPEMRQRVAGVPLVDDHPDKNRLDGPEFYRRVVGMLLLGFDRGDELWAVARVIDAGAAEILGGGEYDTSPGVVYAPDAQGQMVETDRGEKLLIEGVPSLIDHLALIDTRGGNAGVWTKGGTAEIGVDINGGQQNE